MARNRRKKNKNKNKLNKNANPYTSTVEKDMVNIDPPNKTPTTGNDTQKAFPVVYSGTKGYTTPTPYVYSGSIYTWTRCSHVHDEVKIANGKIYASGSRATGDKIKDTGEFHIPKQVSIYLDGLSWKPITGIIVDKSNVDLSPLARGLNYVNWPDMSTIPAPKYTTLLHDTITLLNTGYIVEIGCIGAHGRTGTLIAGLIALTEGLDATASIKATRTRLCEHAIETRSQENMIYALCGEPLLPVPTYTYKSTYYSPYNKTNDYYDDMFDSGIWYNPAQTSYSKKGIEDLWDFDNGELITITYYGKDVPLEQFSDSDFVYNVDQNNFVIMTDSGKYINIEQFDRYMDAITEVPWWIKEMNEVLDINPLVTDTSSPVSFTPETKVKTTDGLIKLNWIIAKDFTWDEELNTDVLFTENDQIITREMYKKIVNIPYSEEFIDYRVSDEEFENLPPNIPNITLKTQVQIKNGIIPLSAVLPSDFTWNQDKLRYELYTADKRIITGKEYLIIKGDTPRTQFLGLQGRKEKEI